LASFNRGLVIVQSFISNRIYHVRALEHTSARNVDKHKQANLSRPIQAALVV
jgi:hypothetical protein